MNLTLSSLQPGWILWTPAAYFTSPTGHLMSFSDVPCPESNSWQAPPHLLLPQSSCLSRWQLLPFRCSCPKLCSHLGFLFLTLHTQSISKLCWHHLQYIFNIRPLVPWHPPWFPITWIIAPVFSLAFLFSPLLSQIDSQHKSHTSQSMSPLCTNPSNDLPAPSEWS